MSSLKPDMKQSVASTTNQRGKAGAQCSGSEDEDRAFDFDMENDEKVEAMKQKLIDEIKSNCLEQAVR